MMKWLQGVSLLLLGFPALSAEAERPNVTSTTWEIYGLVFAVLVVGFLYAYWKQKKARTPGRRTPPAGQKLGPAPTHE